jgi:hypothetical protein
MLSKKTCSLVLVTVLAVVCPAQFNVAYAAVGTTVDTGEVLAFLKDVVQFDMSKYEAKLISAGSLDAQKTTGQYRLDASGLNIASILTVSFTVWEKGVMSCSFYEVSQGLTLYSVQPSANLKDTASGFLQRFQIYTRDTQLTQMRNLLDTVEISSNNTRTVDDLKLEVYVENDRTHLTWSNTLQGTGYSRLILDFQDAELSHFADDRSFYRLGSSEVNISQEEAESIALIRAEPFSYKSSNKEVTGFNVVKEQIRSRMSFLNRGNAMVLYACWIVDLPLNDIYPGGVSYIEVIIWADSGEVVQCLALGYGGFMGSPASLSTEPSPSPDSTYYMDNSNSSLTKLEPEASSTEPFPTVPFAAVSVVVALAIAGLLVYFKKHRGVKEQM